MEVMEKSDCAATSANSADSTSYNNHSLNSYHRN
jgi:hypothetical protein